MKTLVGMAAAAALLGLPLAAAAQGRDGGDGGYRGAPPPNHAQVRVDAYRGDGQMAPRREIAGGGGGRQAFADNRQVYRGSNGYRGGYDARARGFGAGEMRGDERFRDGDDRRFRGGDRVRFGIGVGYGGYPYGYGDDYGDDGYAYSYPNDEGYYQPFAYSDDGQGDAYADDGDDQGYAYDQGGYDQGGYDQGGYDQGGGYEQAPAYGYDGGNRGWSAGAPPADCGSWVWRDRAQRYQWVAAPCPCPPDQQRW